MIHTTNELAKAVVFFDEDNCVLRHMQYGEFLAILDRVVPAYESMGKIVNAVFVEIDANLNIRSAIFAQIPFDHEGFVAPRWVLFYDEILAAAKPGPNLGAGNIKLACTRQPSGEESAVSLWEPDFEEGSGHFSILRQLIKENRLNISFVENGPPVLQLKDQVFLDELDIDIDEVFSLGQYFDADSDINEVDLEPDLHSSLTDLIPNEISAGPAMVPEYEHKTQIQRLRKRFADQLKKLRLDSRLESSKIKAEKNQLKALHSEQLASYDGQVSETESAFLVQQEKIDSLSDALESQARDMAEIKAAAKASIVESDKRHQDEVARLKNEFSLHLQKQLEAQAISVSVKEQESYSTQLEAKDIELEFLREQESVLSNHIKEQQVEVTRLLNQKSDGLLERMFAQGINFVAYQPGAGALNLKLDEITPYMEDPRRLAAQRCEVPEASYIAWLEHYKSPTCVYSDRYGSLCGRKLARADHPRNFKAGINDHCSVHSGVASSHFNKVTGQPIGYVGDDAMSSMSKFSAIDGDNQAKPGILGNTTQHYPGNYRAGNTPDEKKSSSSDPQTAK